MLIPQCLKGKSKLTGVAYRNRKPHNLMLAYFPGRPPLQCPPNLCSCQTFFPVSLCINPFNLECLVSLLPENFLLIVEDSFTFDLLSKAFLPFPPNAHLFFIAPRYFIHVSIGLLSMLQFTPLWAWFLPLDCELL